MRFGPALGLTLFAVWAVGQLARDRTLVTAWAFYLPSVVVLGALLLLAIVESLRRRWRWAGLLLGLALLPAAAVLLVENRWLPRAGAAAEAPAGTAGSAGEGPRADLRVVAWNAADFPRGVERAAAVLRPLAADLVLLSEAPGKPPQELARQLGGGLRLTPVGAMALLARGELLDLEWLAREGELQAAFVRWAIDGRTLGVLAVNVISSPRVPRDPLLERIVAMIEPRAPDLVLGDFNSPRRSRALARLPAGFRHAYDAGGSGMVVDLAGEAAAARDRPDHRRTPPRGPRLPPADDPDQRPPVAAHGARLRGATGRRIRVECAGISQSGGADVSLQDQPDRLQPLRRGCGLQHERAEGPAAAAGPARAGDPTAGPTAGPANAGGDGDDGIAACDAARLTALDSTLAVAPSDDRLAGVLWTQTSAEYHALALATFARARIELDRALADPTASAALEQQGDFAGLPPAVIADVDETLLDNSPYEADRIRVGGRYEPVSWSTWVNRAAAPAIPGALEFARYAAERGVTLFYVTNRAAPLEEKTRANLEALGFPLAAGRDTLLVPGERPDWGSEKTARRAEVAREFRVLLLVGDDLGDFVSGARSAPEERVALAEQFVDRWQRSWILLPNPYYGSWERALLGHERDLPAEEVLRRKLGRLRGSGEPGSPPNPGGQVD